MAEWIFRNHPVGLFYRRETEAESLKLFVQEEPGPVLLASGSGHRSRYHST